MPSALRERAADQPEPLRVVYLSDQGDLAGAELSLLAELEDHVRAGQHVALVCPPNSVLARRAAALGVACHGLQAPRPLAVAGWRRVAASAALAATVARLAVIARQERATVLCSPGLKGGFLCGLAARLVRPRPVVITVNVEGPPGPVLRALTARLSDYVISHAQHRRRWWSAAIGAQRAVLGRTRLQLQPYVKARGQRVRAALGVSRETVLIGMAGQMIAWKGQREFIRAAATVAAAHPAAQFVIVGDTSVSQQAAYLEELHALCARLGLGERVTFLGWRDDMPAVMAALDIFVLPSHHEPFGRVVVEAMAAGKPVIATAAGGPLELIDHGKTGLLVPIGDAPALAAAMRRLIEAPDERRALGRAGRHWLQHEFGLEPPSSMRMPNVCARLTRRMLPV